MKHFFGQKQNEKQSKFLYNDNIDLIYTSFRFFPRRKIAPTNEIESYSNILTGTVSYLIELLTKQPFYMIAKQNIFEPLGMTRSSVSSIYDPEHSSEGYAWAKKYIKLTFMYIPIEGFDFLLFIQLFNGLISFFRCWSNSNNFK